MTTRILVKHARSGGRARAAKLSPERRQEIARLGGLARQAKAAAEKLADMEADKINAEMNKLKENNS